MICLRNISVDTLHRGDTDDDDDNNNNHLSAVFTMLEATYRLTNE
jgi:hypothetical protein